MKYVTRERAMVDRIACPRLIRRFIDEKAEFLFVHKDEVLEAARREDAVPFDVEGVELGHDGPYCSFDAIIKKYGLTDPALLLLAKIIRGADTPTAVSPPSRPGYLP